MKHKVIRVYFDYEKEEQWLNEMAAMGMHLDSFFWCVYTFAEGAPGTYQYRIQLLKNKVNDPESVAYIRFLEENGVEHVTNWIWWLYLRKAGEFDLFTDYSSRARHDARVAALLGILLCALLPAGILNLGLGIVSFNMVRFFNLTVGIVCILLCGFMVHTLIKAIRRWRRNRAKALTEE